jgi:hypothetical protein
LLISSAGGAFAIVGISATEQLPMSVSATWMLMLLATIALMALSEDLARTRGRSAKAWLWVAAITGPLPLAPLLLCVLGTRTRLAS